MKKPILDSLAMAVLTIALSAVRARAMGAQAVSLNIAPLSSNAATIAGTGIMSGMPASSYSDFDQGALKAAPTLQAVVPALPGSVSFAERETNEPSSPSGELNALGATVNNDFAATAGRAYERGNAAQSSAETSDAPQIPRNDSQNWLGRAVRAIHGGLNKRWKFSQMDSKELVRRMIGSRASDRQFAMGALVDRGQGASALSQILKAAENDSDSNVRIEAIDSLGKMKESSSIDLLARIIDKSDEDERIRISAAVALGDIGDAAAVAPLFALLPRTRTTEFFGDAVAQAATASLLKIGEESSLKKMGGLIEEELLRRMRHQRHYSQDYTYSPIANHLLDALIDGAPAQNLNAVLAEVREPNAARLLKRAIRMIMHGSIPETILGRKVSGNAIFNALLGRDA